MTDTPASQETRPTPSEDEGRNAFGTFGGVFTPSILTILGAIMFMRTGFVTGQAGILGAIAILVIAKAITFLTGLSISAVSTNTEVKGGGAYYLISRSLGPEFGGAIGLTLYLAQALSVPFYVLAFGEALLITFGDWGDYAMAIGLGTTLVLFVINYIGASWAIKAQYFILAVLVLAVIAFLGGSIVHFDPAQWQANLSPGYTESRYSFWVVFAIFFPAVTGIMAGVNMSGDLENPARSIPRGTLAAVGVGFVIYLAQILLTGGSQSRMQLVDAPYKSLLDQALFGLDIFVIGGVYAATISSAIGSFMGAPRILQALARDNIFPVLKPFAKGTDRGDEPRRGLWLTLFLTVGVIVLASGASGDALNTVAEILSMFFLYAYGMTNMAAFVESISGNPSFRPRFRQFHWITALLGGAGCFLVTFLISPVSALVAMAVVVVIFLYIERRVLSTTFGDARRGFYYGQVRNNIFKLASQPAHPKNWRPTTLVLSGNPHTRLNLITHATWMASGRGLVTLAEILVGDFHELAPSRRDALKRLDAYIKETKIRAFPEVLVAPSFDVGMATLLQAHSLGPLKPNLIMLGWPSDGARAVPLVQHMRVAKELEMSQLVLVNRDKTLDDDSSKRIDVWWRGHRNGSLMIILAYLLTLNWAWSRSTIRILRSIPPDGDKDVAAQALHDLAEAARVEVEIKIVSSTGSFHQILTTHSADADIVFLGFTPPSNDDDAPGFHDNYSRMVESLPTTCLVCSSGEADVLV